MFKRFVREEEGATMVEYGLMIALIAVVLIVVVSYLGQNLKASFARTNTAVYNANQSDDSGTTYTTTTSGGPIEGAGTP
jgi:pilus assembly protein Flp/PilA